MSVLFAANLFAAAGDDGHAEDAHAAAGTTTRPPLTPPGGSSTHAYLIPIIPAVAFALILLFGKRIPDVKVAKFTIPGGGSLIGLASMLGSLVIAVGTAYQWIHRVDDAQAGEGGAVHALARFGGSILPQRRRRGRPRPGLRAAGHRAVDLVAVRRDPLRHRLAHRRSRRRACCCSSRSSPHWCRSSRSST